MRGGFLHNTVLITPIEQFFCELAACVSREHPIRPGRGAPAVDLFIELQHERIVVEAELTARRITVALKKAQTLEATHLLIITPTSRTAERARYLLVEADPKWLPKRLWILPLGPALQALRDCYLHPPVANYTTPTPTTPTSTTLTSSTSPTLASPQVAAADLFTGKQRRTRQ